MTTRSTDARPLLEQVCSLCGPEHVDVLDGVLSVAPADAQEVAAVLRFAGANDLTVNPRGSGTKADWLDVPRSGLLLRTHRMNSVREHTWQDMTCTVEAGCTWLALESALAHHGQFVALDPLWPAQATVGGIIAANDSGALRLRYGGLRDLILGATIVLADGTVARSGGKVVKNVAGYDLPKLLCGSFGSLGVLTEATFRLHAIPRSTASFTITSASSEDLGALLLGLLDSQYSAQSIQMRTTADAGFALDVQLAALPEVIRSQTDALLALARQGQISAAPSEADVWSARQKQMERSARLHFKATMLPTDIAHVCHAISAMGGAAVAQATGILVASLSSPSQIPALVDLRTRLETGGGSLTLLSAAPDLGPELRMSRWGEPPSAVAVMREIKRQFDPHAILNPGQFPGSL